MKSIVLKTYGEYLTPPVARSRKKNKGDNCINNFLDTLYQHSQPKLIVPLQEEYLEEYQNHIPRLAGSLPVLFHGKIEELSGAFVKPWILSTCNWPLED